MTAAPPTRRVALHALAVAALAGFAISLGGAPYEAYLLAWLGPAGLALALRWLADAARDEPIRRGLGRASLLGLAAGVSANAASCAWAAELFERYGAMPLPIAWLLSLLLFVAQGLPFVLATALAWLLHAMLVERLGARSPSVELALVPSLVIAGSAAPMIFPWRIGNSQTGFLSLAQIAELGGLPLLDLVLASGSVFLLLAWRRRGRARLGAASLACLVVLWPSLWGAHRLAEVRRERAARPSLVVGVVQHDFDVPDRALPERWEEQLAISWELSRELDARGVGLLLWPESSYPWGLDRGVLGLDPAAPDAYPAELGMIAPFTRERAVRVPVVLGAITRDGAGRAYNSVLAIDDARVLGVVDKHRLMPFSERIPFYDALPFLHGLVRPGLEPGPADGGVIVVAGARVGVLNCYEDLMPDYVRALMTHRPSLLSNHTNDAWFGRTRAPWLHHFLARARAIETRRDLVRTVNTGVSGLVASSGETLAWTPTFERRTLRVEVHLSDEQTAWVRFGDWTTPACWALVLAVLARWLGARARGRSPTPPPVLA